jgi:PAS domain S-box-containing protein
MTEHLKLLRALIESSADGLQVVDPATGRFLDVNESACRALGYTRDELLALTVFDVVVGLDRARFDAAMARAKKAGHLTVEARHRHKDGTTHPVEVSLTSVTLKRDYLLAVVRDTTERQRAEAALRESQALYQSLVGQMPAGVFRKDRAGRYVFVNQRFCELHGLTADQVIGRTPGEFVAEEEAAHGLTRPEILQRLRNGNQHHEEILRTGQPIYLEEVHDTADGGKLYLQVVKSAVFGPDGQIMGTQGIQFDITDRKRVELALQETQARYFSLVDQMPAGLFRKDREGRYVFVNPVFCRLKALSAEEILGKTPRELDDYERAKEVGGQLKHPPRQRTLVTQGTDHHEQIMRAGQTIELEEAYPQPDGSVEYFHAVKSPVFDAAGRVIGSQGMQFDITERKRAAEALRANEAFLNAVIEGIPHMIFVKDAKDLRFVKFNKAGEELVGYSRAEMVGKNDYDFFPKELADCFTAKDRHVLRGREVVDIPEEPLQTRHHGQRILHTKKIPIFDAAGQPLYLLGISEDITEQLQAEKKLRQLSSAVEHSPASIVITDLAGNIEYVNPKFTAVTGYAAAEVIGRNPRFLKSGETPPAEYQRLWQTIRAGGEWHGEFHNRRKNGELFWESASISALFDDAGKIAHFVAVKEDITEVKSAREKLRQLSRAVEQSPLTIVITNPAGEIEYVNPRFTQTTGYTAAEALGQNPRILKSGETPPEEYRRLWQTITSGKEWHGEFHNRKKNGELYWELAAISPIFNKGGQITHFLAFKQDITEVKLAREKLRLRESFLSAIAENQPGLLWLKDPEGRLLTVNKAYAAACGRSDPAELQGLTDLDLFPKELAEKYRADDRRLMTVGQPIAVEEMIVVGGKNVWHETFKSPVRDDQGRVIGTTGFALDITNRKQAERQLLEAFSFNHKIIADASVGIVAFKASGQCVLANEAAARTLGATVPKLLAHDFRKIASWRDSGLLRHAEEALAAKAPRQCEANFVSSFGREISLVCHFSPFVQNGEPHLLLIFTDVTEKKKLEAQFLRAQRMESIGTLAGGIAHDLNNVLAPLLISIHLLKDKIADAEGHDLLAMLETNVNRGSDLVKQVLAFGRGIEGERVQVQLKHIARNMKQIVQETFPKSVRLQMDVARDLWLISGDATQIEQVLLNLCVNARDAMPEGGKLSLDLENQILDERYAAANLEAKPGRYVVVTVADTGQGIPREIQERIFEPFFTTKEQGKGTGLGLSTSLAIVKGHGGFIHCYSEPGKGSTFKVYLPADASANAAPAPAAPPRLPRGGNELVLVVDDEEPIRNIARQILERFGYRALPAANGAEAVALYRARGPEIAAVLTDMAMPVMDGATAIAALKAINPGVKIIGSSGLDSGVKTDAGIRHFIRKPYTAEVLLNELHDILREHSGK